MVKEERQSAINEFETRPAQLTLEADNILRAIKKQMKIKYKKNFTISDAVIELKDRANGSSIKFTKEEITQIKTKLKGGL